MYKHLQRLEEMNLLDTLVKQGIISITIAGQKLIYEVYLKERSIAKNTFVFPYFYNYVTLVYL